MSLDWLTKYMKCLQKLNFLLRIVTKMYLKYSDGRLLRASLLLLLRSMFK
jgi:hypothetical protein